MDLIPHAGGLTRIINSSDEANTTELPPGYAPLQVPVYLQVIISSLYGVIIIAAIGGNGIVCYIVVKAKRMRTVMNLFIVSLAISDILMAALCIPFTFIANLVLNFWPFGPAMCPLVVFLQAVTVLLSSFTLVVISIDRYFAILYPLRMKMTKSQALVVIVVVWIVALSIAVPIAIVARVHKYVDYVTAPKFCVEIWYNDSAKFSYSISLMMLQYFIPLVLLAFTYGRIVVALCVKTPGEAASIRDKRLAASKRKLTRMIMAVVVIYAICWLPLHVITIIGDVTPDIYDIKYVNIIWLCAHWLAMSNSCYNPIIYCLLNANFRNGFMRVFQRCSCGIIASSESIELQAVRLQDTNTTSYSFSSLYRNRLLVKPKDVPFEDRCKMYQ